MRDQTRIPLNETERQFLEREAGYQVQRLSDIPLPHSFAVRRAKAMLTGWGQFDNHELKRRIQIAVRAR